MFLPSVLLRKCDGHERTAHVVIFPSHWDSEDIMTKLKEARSVIPDATSSQDRIKPNYDLEKHPSRLDAIKPNHERGKTEDDKLECAASSLPTIRETGFSSSGPK